MVITQSGSVQEALYNQYINGACKEFKLVANMTDGYLAVAEGKADVCLCNTASAQLYADANGGMSIPDYRFEVDPNMNGTCVAMPMDGDGVPGRSGQPVHCGAERKRPDGRLVQ